MQEVWGLNQVAIIVLLGSGWSLAILYLHFPVYPTSQADLMRSGGPWSLASREYPEKAPDGGMEHIPARVGEMEQPLTGWGVALGWWGSRREKQALAAGGAWALSKVQVQQALLRARGAVAVAPVH